jgi:predicted metal-dependent hydrolase
VLAGLTNGEPAGQACGLNKTPCAVAWALKALSCPSTFFIFGLNYYPASVRISPIMNQDISNLGNVIFVRSLRARHLRITVHPDKTVRVTIPRAGGRSEAEKFLQSKIPWLKKHLQKNQLQDLPDTNIDIKKAQDELFGRLDCFAEKYNLSYARASFRCQKTKWGSCSGKNNINLNVNIVFLPQELQDYILLHELCHILHKNHSKRFWGQLDEYIQGRAKILSKQLKKYRMKLTA